MHITRGTIVAAVASTIIASAAWSPAAGSPASCGEIPEPQRWVEAGQPDTGSTPTVSAHRGASGLAPENTLWAYRHAFAYGAEMVEVDVRTTADGHYVSMHDDTVDRTTNGTGSVASFTLEQIKELNAADYAPWSGTEYDPARVPTLEDIMAVAASAGGGIEFDIKDVADPSDLATMADQFGILERSAFNSQDPRIQAAYPAARLIYNRDTFEPPGALYAIGSTYTYFGSRLDEYSPESIAEIHDACGLVIPHAYDRTKGDEAADLAFGRSIGIDGAQVNNPDIAAAALGEPVPTALMQGPLTDRVVTRLVGEERVGLHYNQGLARIDGGWIASNTYGIAKVDDNQVPGDVNEFTAIPQELQDKGYNHVGDVDVANGFVYAPLEQDDYSRGTQMVARYRLDTLDFVDAHEIAAHHASWVAVEDGVLWSTDEFTGNVVTRFRTDTWEQLPSLILSKTIDRVQGGDLGFGYLWLSTDDDHNGLYRVDLATGEVADAGSIGHIPGEGEGIDVTDLPSGSLHAVTTHEAFAGVHLAHLRPAAPDGASEPASLCLVNSNNGFGIPNKPVAIDRGDGQAVEITTGRSGCASVPPGLGDNPHARFTGDPATQPSSTDQPSQGPDLELERAHAHNDYDHERPLFDALANGFKSVEADIWLVGDRLLIGHDYPDPTLTLENLYLDPLKSLIEANGGSAYPGDTDYLTLLVDVKSEASTTYAELDRHLQPYSNILTTFTQEGMQRGPVTIIVSGNRDRAAMQEQQVRLAAYDGRMADLGNGDTASLTPLISDSWTTVFDWDGTGEMPQEERQRLDEIVQTAHANGQRVRFWNTPDEAGPARKAVWEVELEAHVDLFNTDHLAELRAFLLGADLMPNKPYVP